MRRLLHILILGGVLSSIAACTSPLYVAQGFVVGVSDIHILLLPPDQLFQSFYPFHPDSLQPGQEAKMDHPSIRFSGRVDDSLYVELFMSTLTANLERFDVNIYGPGEVDAFNNQSGRTYIFDMVQVEFMEYVDSLIFYGYARNEEHRSSESIHVLEHNVWVDFSAPFLADHQPELLFASFSSSDYVEGRFVRNRATGGVDFLPDRFLLNADDVSNLAILAGRQNAQYIFDYILNLYVATQTGESMTRYFQYDLERHSIEASSSPGYFRIGPAE